MKVKRGFTLVEVIVTMAILSIVLSAIYSIFFSSTRLSNDQLISIQSQDTLRIASLKIEQDIRRSSQRITIIQREDDCFVLKDVENMDSENVIVYCLRNHVLLRNDTIVIDGLSSFTISNPNGDENTIDITLESTQNGKGNVHEQRIHLRNR